MRYLSISLCLLLLPALAAAQAKNIALDPDHAAKMAQGLDLFKKKVRPLLESQCLRCHGGKRVESEFDLSDREGFLKGGLIGTGAVAGKSKDSLVMKLVRHEKEPHMPDSRPKMAEADIAAFARWIDLGAPYDSPLVKTKKKATPWTEKVVAAGARDFWSLQPLEKAAVPSAGEGWARTSIDRFILAKLRKAGITPNPLASWEILLRRAHFDLTGLPPTPEEIAAFDRAVKADPEKAWNALLDRLLASPHYGERWARHWLDLARFAESHGFEHDYDRPTAYHYRDFVIEALNQGMPYDRFVRWQIAGDELAPEDALAWKATGFLAAGVHSTQITKSEVEKHRYDELDDKLATLGTAFLGLSIGCARCHDHKYDPIPQRDYYRLLSTFTSTVRSEVDLPLDPDGYRRAREAFEKAHAPLADALRAYVDSELPPKLAAWEAAGANTSRYDWDILEPDLLKSREGAKLTLEPDGAILATGKNGKFDVYTFGAVALLPEIRHFRLEALAHPALVKKGPGRAANGNFALTDLQVQATPLGDPKAKPRTLKLRHPRVTFEQKGLPIAAAIDADRKSAWAVDPQFGKDHAAAFELVEPLTGRTGYRLTVTLKFENNAQHNLGRLRLAVGGTTTSPKLQAPGLSGRVRQALAVPAAKRTPEQRRIVLDWFATTDPGWIARHRKVQDHLARAPKPATVKALVATEGRPAIRLHTQGEDLLPHTHFLRRGDVAQKEGIAQQGFLQVLMPSPDASGKWTVTPPPGVKQTYRRTALANWLTDVEKGAGHLLARVIVNRLWQHHMGRGIVATPSDFGNRGEPPTHPELLDWLASELIRGGWKLKPIHKLILTSAVWMQTGAFDEARAKVDRENTLWWRKPAVRLEAEAIRDSLLAVAGELDRTLYGKGTLDPASKRRSIYFTVKRSRLMPMMVVFDAPEALNGIAERPTTTIAPQALFLLNNAQVRRRAASFAAKVLGDGTAKPEAILRSAYRTALARDPQAAEMEDALAFLASQEKTYTGADARRRALTDFCQVLLCLNEFVYIE